MKTKQTNKHRKTVPVSVRLTDDERNQIKAEAKAKGLSLGEYVRLRLFDSAFSADGDCSAQATRLSPGDRQKLIAQILVQVGQSEVGKTLGEIAEAVRLGIVEATPELLDALHNTKAELHDLRRELVKALGLRGGTGKDGGRQ